jgi:replicative DNA helicase
MQRVPPSDVELEAAILGTFLLAGDRIAIDVAMMLDADVFYQQSHQVIFRAIAEVVSSGATPDLVSVAGALKDSGDIDAAGGAVYLASLTDCIPRVSTLRSDCARLLDKYTLRRMIMHCSEVIERCYSNNDVSDITDFAEAGLFDLVSGPGSKSAKPLSELVGPVVDSVIARSKADGQVTGLSTGFARLDTMTAGMHNGDLVVLAARPSMGKTALAVNMAVNVASAGKPVMV